MSRLVPCTACARHVRVDEGACPFCDAAMDGAHDPVIERPGRIGRAAILAFRTLAVGAAGATVGCGSTTGLELDDAMVVRADAGPEADDAGTTPTDAGPPAMDAGYDAGTDAGGIIALYGGPMPADAGTDAGAGVVPAYGGPFPVEDAGSDAGWDGGGAVNLYGAPSP